MARSFAAVRSEFGRRTAATFVALSGLVCSSLVCSGLVLSGCVDTTHDREPVPAGTSPGGCIPFVLEDGTRVCLMSAPQFRPSVSSAGLSTAALGDPGARGPLPRSVDLRSQFLNGCLEVRNQAECGWCVSNAVGAALDAMYCESGCPSPRASVAHIVAQGHGGTIGDCGEGWFPEEAMQAAMMPTVAEETWPYAGGTESIERTRPSEAELMMQGIYRGTSFSEIPRARDVNQIDTAFSDGIKRALASGRAVVVTSEICDHPRSNWDNGRTIITAQPECYPSSERISGYHAYVIVGYDDATDTFIGLNSWGANWGDGGYFRLSKLFVQQKITSAHYFNDVDRSRAMCPMNDAGVVGDAGTSTPTPRPSLADACAARSGDCGACVALSGCEDCDGRCVARGSVSGCEPIRNEAECPSAASDSCAAHDGDCGHCLAQDGCTFCGERCVDWSQSHRLCTGTRVAFDAHQCNDVTMACEEQMACGDCLATPGCGYCAQRGSDLHAATTANCVGGTAAGSNRASCEMGAWRFGEVAMCMPVDAGRPRDGGARDSGITTMRDTGATSTPRDAGTSTRDTSCKPLGDSCEDSLECCNMDCVNGMCGCIPRGGACVRSNQCCGGALCEGGICS